ncbi:MAG: DUF948 domain-containing protein [Armatimonadota bacterium]
METLFYIISSIAVIVAATAFVVLVRGLLSAARKVERAGDDISRLAKSVSDRIVPSASETLEDIDRLVRDLDDTALRVDRVAAGVEGLLDAEQAAEAVGKLAKSSAAKLLSVYAGLRQGIRSLRGS